LAEDRLAELEWIRSEFFNDGRLLDAIDRETLLQRVLHAKAIVIDVVRGPSTSPRICLTHWQFHWMNSKNVS
jgi:hypothetical protein